MGNAAAVQAKVQQFLVNNFSGVTLEQNGFSLRQGSARLWVRVGSKDDDSPTIITLTCPLLSGVRDTPETHKYVAYHSDDWVFGHLSLYRQESGRVNLFMTHSLLGDYLDEDEVGYAVGWLLGTADDLDDELQSQYGGEKFHE